MQSVYFEEFGEPQRDKTCDVQVFYPKRHIQLNTGIMMSR